MREFAAAQWERAQRSLTSAGKLVRDDPDSAASVAYYAAFHALTALFGLRGRKFSKHTEIRGALHRDLIRTGVLSQDAGKDYDFLMELREIGDYGGQTQVPIDSAQLAVQKADAFIAAIAAAEPELAR